MIKQLKIISLAIVFAVSFGALSIFVIRLSMYLLTLIFTFFGDINALLSFIVICLFVVLMVIAGYQAAMSIVNKKNNT